MGFTSALLRFGVRSVVASAVPVLILQVGEFLAAVHEGLVAGRSVADALASAQSAFVGQRGGQHLTAAFAVYGRG